MLRLVDGAVVVVDVKPVALIDKPKVAEVLVWTGRLKAQPGWRYEVWSQAGAVKSGRPAGPVWAPCLRHRGSDPVGGAARRRPLGFAQTAHLRAAMLALLWWRHPGLGPCRLPPDASLTARSHFRCRTKNPVAASPADCGTPVCPPMLAFSVFSWEPKASKRSRAAWRSFPSSSHWSRTCSGIVT